MAPEVCRKEQHDAKIDVYSGSMVVCFMLFGDMPFPKIPGFAVSQLMEREHLRPNLTSCKNKELAKLLTRAWDKNPHLRPHAHEMVAELRQRTARGLGPDLILARAPVVNTLLREGLITPVPRTPAMDRTLAQVMPFQLNRVRNGVDLSGLPFVELVTVACYNRKTIPDPPRTTSELMARAAAG